MKRAIILRGPSGCGKTTWAQSTDQLFNYACVSTDDFWTRREVSPDGGYAFDPSRLSEAHAWCREAWLQTLRRGADDDHRFDVILDNTNIHNWEWQAYAVEAVMAGYTVHVHEWIPFEIDDIKLCIERNRHGVPADVIARMCLEYEPVNEKWFIDQGIYVSKNLHRITTKGY